MRTTALLLLALALVGHAQSQTIEEDWIFSVAYIANPSTGAAGTGFFVGRHVTTNESAIFLVSNRHVLEPKDPTQQASNLFAQASVIITREESNQLYTTTLTVTLRETNGAPRVVKHPNEVVDVAVLEVTPYVVEKGALRKGYKVGFVPEEKFLSKAAITSTHVVIGQQIITLGYPLNLIEGSTAIAVARSGVIASPADRDFRGKPIFLIDSATIRGSSGSPVFLPLRTFKIDRDAKGTKRVNFNHGYTPALLGIAAAAVTDWELVLRRTDMFGLPPSEVSVVTTANLGIVFRADTISETLDATGLARVPLPAQIEY